MDYHNAQWFSNICLNCLRTTSLTSTKQLRESHLLVSEIFYNIQTAFPDEIYLPNTHSTHFLTSEFAHSKVCKHLYNNCSEGKEVTMLQELLSARHFPTHAVLCLLTHGRHFVCLNSGDFTVPSFFWTRFWSLHFYNLWEVCPSEMWVRISRHGPLSHKLLEKNTKNGKIFLSNVLEAGLQGYLSSSYTEVVNGTSRQ